MATKDFEQQKQLIYDNLKKNIFAEVELIEQLAEEHVKKKINFNKNVLVRQRGTQSKTYEELEKQMLDKFDSEIVKLNKMIEDLKYEKEDL